ncbi:hypothetical protein SAMN05421504_113187 [Amycolatopsis xylanica]|uniref:SalK n=1 Tax=Amycolatopsis xylanica TaxID=589385 RepID=A0A1H3SFH3_9PSEU|nr:hypothetical protein [Amycolatopsis xylanica]SDZ36654.1 hypothetical protein SAMN05421504_113187 [Amycolatopsis xylanica]
MSTGAARRCAQAVNALHSIPYFTAELGTELEPFGVTEWSTVYFAGRASPLGHADAPLVTAVFNAFAPEFVAARVPQLWQRVSPERAIIARQAAAGATLERLLGAEVIESSELAEAAKLAEVAAAGCALPGRPLHAANAALETPAEPHIALWHAATMLREHRGDGHVAVLGYFDLTGVDALVLDCASRHGMPDWIVRPNRGWTEDQWSAGRDRLAARGLIDGESLTERGAALRDEVERETGRLDRLPYEALDEASVERLAVFVHGLVRAAAGVFPPPLGEFFAPDDEKWNALDEREDRS